LEFNIYKSNDKNARTIALLMVAENSLFSFSKVNGINIIFTSKKKPVKQHSWGD